MRSYLALSLLGLCASAACCAQTPASARDAAPTSVPSKPVMFDLAGIDKTADPCTDFYQYACGNWRASHPIPSDQARWGRFNELADFNQYLLYNDLKAAAAKPKTPLQAKYGNFYAACMNTPLIDKLGARPILPELTAIRVLPSVRDLAAFNVRMLHAYDSAFFFSVSVQQDQVDSTKQILSTGQGGLSLPDRDYYLQDDDRTEAIRAQFHDHVVKMFTLLGDAPDKASTEADDVLRIETALAKGSMSRVERRDPAKRYHIMTVAELQKLSPAFNWTVFLNGQGLAAARTLNVSAPGFITAVNTVLTKETLSAVKSYMRWHTLHGVAEYLSAPFAEENFHFFGAQLAGQKEEQPRWKRCTAMTDRALGYAVGQDWVKQNFPPDAKGNMEKLVHELEAALASDIDQLPWMSEVTKKEAKLKLDAIRDKIGYPAHWRNYSTLMVSRADLLGNEQRAGTFERKRNLARLGKPVDETEWGMTPPTVNAYYESSMNDINFPAGILQPPFFDNTKDPAVNFGGIGVVIGHEMTHGFDDEGSKYDLHGNVRVWWTPDDLKKFGERTECEAKEYDGFEVAPGQNLNGHLTLGENTADNGGMRIAFMALQDVLAKQGSAAQDSKLDGYTPEQRFFLGFGQVWCENITEQTARVRAKTDPHSSGKWRVNGTVQNFDEFGKAFGCKVGDPMMPASGGCRVW